MLVLKKTRSFAFEFEVGYPDGESGTVKATVELTDLSGRISANQPKDQFFLDLVRNVEGLVDEDGNDVLFDDDIKSFLSKDQFFLNGFIKGYLAACVDPLGRTSERSPNSGPVPDPAPKTVPATTSGKRASRKRKSLSS